MKLRENITIAAFCGFLLAMTAAFFLLPKTDFSENEKRYLAEVPEITWEKVSSGDWGNDAETYMADHIPGRDFFVGLNAYFDLWTGRQVGKDIWLKDGRLVEAPVQLNESAIARNMKAVNAFGETVEQQVDLMIVPSAGWAMGLAEYQDAAIIVNATPVGMYPNTGTLAITMITAAKTAVNTIFCVFLFIFIFFPPATVLL